MKKIEWARINTGQRASRVEPKVFHQIKSGTKETKCTKNIFEVLEVVTEKPEIRCKCCERSST